MGREVSPPTRVARFAEALLALNELIPLTGRSDPQRSLNRPDIRRSQ